MTQTITAIFDSYDAATLAVARVRGEGISERDISVLSNDTTIDTSRFSEYRPDVDREEDGSGAASGAGLGAAAGGAVGLLAGLGLLAIPGLGPVVAAGWLAATFVGAGAGGAAGGLVGAMVGAGMSDDDAHAYAEGLRRGSTVVTVRAPEASAARIRQILHEGSYDISERSRTWRDDGWTGRTAY